MVATEPRWPECDVIVGNPPFLGNKRMRGALGAEYVEALWKLYGNRIPATSDLCCYWFERARAHIESGKCQRAGLLATTAIKQVGSRQVLHRIADTGKAFFAISDRDWIFDGASIRISMIGFAAPGCADVPVLDGQPVVAINSDLTSGSDASALQKLAGNLNHCFMGTTKVGAFDIEDATARQMLTDLNPDGRANSDVLRPFRNGSDLVRQCSNRWIVDFGVDRPMDHAAMYEAPFQYLVRNVKGERERNNRRLYREKWWIHAESRPGMRNALGPLSRYIATARVAKHRLFVWLDTVVLPDSKVIGVAFDDDARFGVLQSHLHELWTLKTCGWHGVGNDATYNPTLCFETFPLPQPMPEQESAIAAAAKELDSLRNNWLNPPEWTKEEVLEFPGSVNGPWAKYVQRGTGFQPVSHGQDAHSTVGLVRYPRLVPQDAEYAAKLAGRTLTNLYNERPTWLDLAHKKLDAAVSAAYGWPADLSDEEILKRLLELNLSRASQESKHE